ncbi:hypothetical protein [Natronohydrobacter thiooxidans]|uniref:hypothetical protein n=1 Tax=Natronohydrobacter thiooxidans TaxID=87172 RepID=UPI0008FF1051|nr:hypothetical protein [Natronohydrobacter thiooxidans]
MTSELIRYDLVKEVCGFIERVEELGFLQTREILLVGLSILSQETPHLRKQVVVPLRAIGDDHANRDTDWSVKEAGYLQMLIDAQDGTVDGMDALSFCDVFNKHHLGTM